MKILKKNRPWKGGYDGYAITVYVLVPVMFGSDPPRTNRAIKVPGHGTHREWPPSIDELDTEALTPTYLPPPPSVLSQNRQWRMRRIACTTPYVPALHATAWMDVGWCRSSSGPCNAARPFAHSMVPSPASFFLLACACDHACSCMPRHGEIEEHARHDGKKIQYAPRVPHAGCAPPRGRSWLVSMRTARAPARFSAGLPRAARAPHVLKGAGSIAGSPGLPGQSSFRSARVAWRTDGSVNTLI
jgi:hypothetical protein